jgi:hypothetical protein
MIWNWIMAPPIRALNECHHVVVKAHLIVNTPVLQAIHTILEQTKELEHRYDAEINRQRRTIPRVLDNSAFSAVKKKLTNYALELSIPGWPATKRTANDIEEGKEEFEFDHNKGCTFSCKLPARYCRHWMYASVVEETPLPHTLFHPC